MKPYFLVLRNIVKFTLIRAISCKKFNFGKVNIFATGLRIQLQKNSEVSMGNHLVSDGSGNIIVGNSGHLNLEDNIYFNDGIMISCKQKVSVGAGCQFGPNVKIFDNNHKFTASDGVSSEHVMGEVIIGKKCWIASNVVILRNTHIGDNCVIGAGCVIKGDIPSGSIVTQSRELIIRKIEDRL